MPRPRVGFIGGGAVNSKPGMAIEFQGGVSSRLRVTKRGILVLSFPLAALVAAEPARPFTAIPFNLTITLSPPPATSPHSLVPNPSLLLPSPDLSPPHERHSLTRHPPSFVLFANFP